VVHQFKEAKFGNGGSILSSSQFLLLPKLPQKTKLVSKGVKIDSKIIGLLTTIQIPETHCRTSLLVVLVNHKQTIVGKAVARQICAMGEAKICAPPEFFFF
jgi:hypothetical protein